MLTRRRFHAYGIGLGATLAGLPSRSVAQDAEYPIRPIKIIVPFAVGGGPDVLTRKLAVRWSEALGKGGVVVDNIVGAGGISAAQSVTRLPADGYHLMLGSSAQLVQKAMMPSVRFDPLRDFTHITRILYTPSILVVAADSPYRSIDELVDAARREPGKLNYASGGVGSAAHLAAAAVVLQSKVDVVHIPYKGSVEIVPSIVTGATQFAFPIASTAIPHIQAGKVRALAVTSARRMPSLPTVPTLVESFGTPDLALDPWFGVWAPPKTPPAIVDTLFRTLGKAYDDPALRAESEAAGAAVALSESPADFTRFMVAETAKLERLVKLAKLDVRK